MVNVKNLFGMAVMATALVGCSSNDNLNPNANEGAGKAGAAYASFKINLPTVSGTRADGEPTFAEGDAKEYEVKNGTILIFDNSGNFVESAELGTMNPWTKETDANGVTTAAAVTVQFNNVKVGTSYKALVLLNNNSETTTPKVKLPISSTTTTDTYTSWSAKVGNATPAEYLKTDGIFMANAPKYTGKTTEPTTLVKINKVYASREQAQANPATVVYVERGLAKVTMDKFASEYPISGGTYDGDKVVIKTWQLDVTNKSTFPVHQTGDLMKKWDQIWNTDYFYDNTSSAFKRVYWGTDPNYSGAANQTLKECNNAFNMIGNKDVKGLPGTPQYCLENTFDLDNMKQGQTTRVVFKAVYTPKALVGATVKTFYKVANNTAIWKEDDLKQQIKTVALTVMGITDPTEQAMYSVDLTKGSNISGVAGQHLIATDNIIFDPGKSTKTTKVNDGVIKKINEKLGLSEDPTTHKVKVGISTYLNGEAYYIARIMHFNTLTPWKPGQPTYKDASLTPEQSNKKYLGRYGVLRNNWYSLSVHSISNLGYPEVPEVKPNVPDDENDKYINVEVKILDWALRKQVIDL